MARTMRRGPRARAALSVAWLAGVSALAPPARGAGQDAVICDVRAIHGSGNAGAVDTGLALLRRQLSKPPFSAYKSFKLLGLSKLDLAQGKRKQLLLPTKKVLRLTFKERILGPKQEVRLRLHLSITPPRALGFLPGTLFTIADRGTLLVAGDRYDGGTLIVGITCRSK